MSYTLQDAIGDLLADYSIDVFLTEHILALPAMQARERVIEAAREFTTVKRTDLLPGVIARLHDAVAALDGKPT